MTMTDQPAAASPTALDDLLVLDLSLELGAYCTKLLADLGARVIRVEPPTGDPLRLKGPFYTGPSGVEVSLRHLHYNTSKQSVTLDLDQPEGAVLLARRPPGGDEEPGPAQDAGNELGTPAEAEVAS